MNTNLLGAACALSLAMAAPAAHAQDDSSDPANSDGKSTLVTEAIEDIDETLRVQILLDRANFSPGVIDGAMGGNTRAAIAGFQRYHDLTDSGELDEATRKALDDVSGPALTRYTIREEDVEGPFTNVPSGMEAKSKMDALGYESAAEALGEKFHATPGLLRELNPGKSLDQAGTEIVVPNVNTGELPSAAKIIVDESDKVLMLVDEDDRVYAQFPTTTGSENDPLPIGEWKVNGVAADPVFHYNPDLFWDSDPSDEAAKIPPGPNNPVGVVWIDLSKEHYGIHGTPEPTLIGKTASHGCIRLTNWSADLVAAAVSPGVPVILRE